MFDTEDKNYKAIHKALKAVPDYEFKITEEDVYDPPEITGGQIQALRISLGMTQTTFGKYLGVTIGAEQQWEYGNTKPSKVYRRLMHILSICSPIIAESTKNQKTIKL